MAYAGDFERYERYLERLSDESRLPLPRSSEDAIVGWGLRRLSPADFASLAQRAGDDVGLGDRWSRRLEIGYDRERAALVDEIEDGFADLPHSDELASGKSVGNAA